MTGKTRHGRVRDVMDVNTYVTFQLAMPPVLTYLLECVRFFREMFLLLLFVNRDSANSRSVII